jgi:aldose 1-epimerase
VTAPPSGEQFELVHGEQRASVVEVGGGLRCYSVAGREVIESYPLEAICDGAHGAPLIPWPNRLADGRYEFDGQERQLALSEPERHNAIHGLLRWRSWRELERSPAAVTVGTRLHPLPGYPYSLDVRIAYELDQEGLTVTTTASNVGEQRCPYGCGQHPYLSPGEGRIDDCTLELPAAVRILTDDQRSLPSGREAVAGTAFDFRAPRAIGDLQLDSPFTDLARDSRGRVTVRLGCPDGRTVELWAGEGYELIELYTGDTLAPARRRRGLAVEPMSCPPNALASGEGLVVLEPGERHTSSWGVRLL